MSHVVETRAGRVKGEPIHETGRDVVVFRGIPFAAAPAGARRWKAPRPPEPWTGVRDALAFGPEAPQLPSPLPFDQVERPQAEDCLSLNVWTSGCDGARRPVMVWIHGGGFQTGGSGRPLYDGAALAAHGDVVLVSLNYRLGALGLVSHPALADREVGVEANWALLDQIAALEWVRDHAEAFGGDPANVTVFGESAGGASVALLLCAPRARGLFRRAMIQSASPLPISRAQGLEATDALLDASGCAELGPIALRGLSVEQLLESQPRWAEVAARGRTAVRPIVDGEVLPHGPAGALAAGATRDVELVVGSNADEWKLFGYLDPHRGDLDAARLQKRVRGLVGERATPLIDTYRDARGARGADADPWSLWCAIQTDLLIRAPALAFLEQHVAGGGRGYAYEFTWPSPVPGLGACHGLELPFCFGTLDTAAGMHGFAGKGPEATRLADTMRDAWLAFARGETADWPAYDAARRRTRCFGRECGVVDAPGEDERASWPDPLADPG